MRRAAAAWFPALLSLPDPRHLAPAARLLAARTLCRDRCLRCVGFWGRTAAGHPRAGCWQLATPSASMDLCALLLRCARCYTPAPIPSILKRHVHPDDANARQPMCNAQLFFLISSITKPESRTPVNPPNQTASPHNIENLES
jgi:hypothetical protein